MNVLSLGKKGESDLASLMRAIKAKPDIAASFYNHCTKTIEVRQCDHTALGYMMRKLRIVQSVSLRRIAKKLNWSPFYVSDLELGRRSWSVNRVQMYLNALPQMPEAPSLHIR